MEAIFPSNAGKQYLAQGNLGLSLRLSHQNKFSLEIQDRLHLLGMWPTRFTLLAMRGFCWRRQKTEGSGFFTQHLVFHVVDVTLTEMKKDEHFTKGKICFLFWRTEHLRTLATQWTPLISSQIETTGRTQLVKINLN